VTIMLVTVRHTPHIGGIETLLGQTLPTLRSQGHEFVVVTGDDEWESAEVVDGIPVHRFPFLAELTSEDPGRILAVSGRLREIEADHRVHLRHVHGLDFNLWFVLRRHRQSPLPFVVTVHQTLDAAQPHSPVTHDALRAADAVTAVSEAVRSSVVAAVPALTDRVQVLSNGISVPAPHVPWSEDGPLLMVGRLDHTKGFDVGIRALAALATRPKLRLRIAGTGPEEAQLRAVAARERVEGRVDFLGPLRPERVWQEMSAASIVVVPTRAAEGFCFVAVEAAQLARPVVAARTGGLPETVVDGVTGDVVEPDDVAALAGAIDALLDDPDRARRLGEAAQRRAVQYDAMRCAQSYSELYRSLEARSLTVGRA
jgi:glycosyltransferase involved in cell wall biosynthesis